MGAARAARTEPIEIQLKCTQQTWRQVAAVVKAEMELRGWNASQLRLATGDYRRGPLAADTVRKVLGADYVRSPELQTLVRVFCFAFKSSGWEMVIRSSGSKIRRA